jgi:hypothetical protein
MSARKHVSAQVQEYAEKREKGVLSARVRGNASQYAGRRREDSDMEIMICDRGGDSDDHSSSTWLLSALGRRQL